MTNGAADRQQQTAPPNPPRNRIGTWIVLTVLALLLVAAAVIGYLGWTSTDTSVPISGYIAMAFGVIFSLAVGTGLMALLFYSSRAGYDEPAVLIEEPEDDRDDAGKSDKGKGS
jgi:small-conductance mechanosensitive channel